MSYRCLETWTFENQTINLSKITDFSIITSEIESYTAPTYTLLFNQDTLPSWVTTEDVVYAFNTDTNSYDFIKTDELSIVFGKYVVSGNTWYGAIIYNLLSNTIVDYWGNRWSDNKPRYYYVAIVIDDISERAFLLLYTDYSGASSSVKRYSGGIISFMYNNIDLLYDAIYGVYRGGGAGSGYIGNSLLFNKKMVGYNVLTSSAEGTKTESVNEVSASAVSGKPKSGNGYAKIKLISQAHQNVNISASNQLKNDGVSPTVVDGQMGSYDSESNSYFFNNICSWKYTNGVITKSQLQSAKILILEMEVKLLNDSQGNYTDTTIHIRYGDTGYRLLGVIAGNGIITTGDYSFFWMNNGNVQKNDTAPLDVNGNRGAFHNVRFILEMSNGTINNLKCYIDGDLYKSKEINQVLELEYNEYNIFCDTLQKSYVKSYKVEVV